MDSIIAIAVGGAIGALLCRKPYCAKIFNFITKVVKFK